MNVCGTQHRCKTTRNSRSQRDSSISRKEYTSRPHIRSGITKSLPHLRVDVCAQRTLILDRADFCVDPWRTSPVVCWLHNKTMNIMISRAMTGSVVPFIVLGWTLHRNSRETSSKSKSRSPDPAIVTLSQLFLNDTVYRVQIDPTFDFMGVAHCSQDR